MLAKTESAFKQHTLTTHSRVRGSGWHNEEGELFITFWRPLTRSWAQTWKGVEAGGMGVVGGSGEYSGGDGGSGEYSGGDGGSGEYSDGDGGGGEYSGGDGGSGEYSGGDGGSRNGK